MALQPDRIVCTGINTSCYETFFGHWGWPNKAMVYGLVIVMELYFGLARARTCNVLHNSGQVTTLGSNQFSNLKVE